MSPSLADEMGLDRGLFTMMKGEPGTRKSTSALSYPTPQFWVSHDKKMNSLLIPMKNWGIKPRDVEYENYDDWDKPRQKLESLQLNCKYKLLVIDSITSLADGTLRATKKFKGADGKKVKGIPVNSVEDYNAEDSVLSEMLALCKDIHEYHKIDVILIAHVMVAEYRSVTNAQTHVSRTIVTAGKRISLKIPAYCEEVYHFNIEKEADVTKEGKYTCITRHTGDDFARTILPLPGTITFNDRPLYTDFIKPKIEEFKNDLKKQTEPSPTNQPTNIPGRF